MKYRLIAALLLCSVGLSACSFSLATDLTPPPGYVPPTPVATLGPSYPAEPPDSAAGAAIFAEKCAPCHGATGMGDGPQGAQLGVSVPALGSADLARQAAPASWYATVTQGRIDKFMPPFSSLSDAERWDVVAYAMSLSDPADQVAAGKAIYEANCANCHGADGAKVSSANFTDQEYMASRSGQDLAQLVTAGSGSQMHAFQDKLSQEQLWSAIAYLRTLSLKSAGPTATNTPQPTDTSTPLPASPTATAGAAGPTPTGGTSAPTAASSASPQPTAATLTPKPTVTKQGFGSVTGTVSNGSGGTVPAGLSVTLHGLEHGQTSTTGTASNPTEIVTTSVPVGADGKFRFDGVEMPVNRLFYVTVDYNGNSFASASGVVAADTKSLDLPVSIYDSTTDTSGLSISQAHILMDVSPGATSAQVLQFIIISNRGNKVVVRPSTGEPVVKVVLPQGASNVVFDDNTTLGTSSRYVATKDGFGDTNPVLPGEGTTQIVYGYDIPYDNKVDVSQTYTLPVESGSVLFPQGMKITGDGFSAGETRDLQGVTFSSSLWQNLPAGQALAFSLSGKPTTTAPTSTGSTSLGVIFGIAALALALIAVGAWFFLRQRRQEQALEADLDDSAPAIQSEDDVLDAIIALDDAFRAGSISEEAYRARREELKARLKK
jgi:mono/diheme cytochrome c family protein